MINKRLINLLNDSKKYIGLTVFLNWISLIANIFSLFTISRLLENLLRGSATRESIVSTFFIVLGVIGIRAICNILSSKTSFKSSAEVKKVLRGKIYQKLLGLGVSYNDKIPTSEVVQVAVEGVEQLEIFFGAYLPQLFYSLLAPITLFLVLSFVNFKSALVLLVAVPLIPLSIVAVQKFAKKLLSKYWGTYTQMGDSFLENIQGLTTLKIYQADGLKSDEMDVEAENFRKITMRVLTMQLNSITIMDLIAFGGAGLGVIVSVSEFMRGNLGFGGTFLIIMLSAEFFIPLRLLGSFFHIAMNGMAASEKIFKILDLEDSPPGTMKIEKRDIAFENVGFAYDESRLVLEDISFNIKEGDFVSFVGESGSGKSTISSLIMGINKAYDGSIKIGDTEISHIYERNIMDNITLVNHNSYLFKGTVRDNLLMANKNASDQDMDNILRRVNLYDFLSNENGLDTELQERGSNLSGGQAQRLVIARAILHDSPIYIFDEATSNIDVESELKIMEIIEDLAKTKTVILISHRLANVVNSDKIFVLEKGRIVEEGNHDKLIGKNSVYKKLYSNQASLEEYSRTREEVKYA